MFLTIKLCTHAELVICIKMDLALNNLQRLICHKTQPTNENTKWFQVLLILNIFLSIVYLFACS